RSVGTVVEQPPHRSRNQAARRGQRVDQQPVLVVEQRVQRRPRGLRHLAARVEFDRGLVPAGVGEVRRDRQLLEGAFQEQSGGRQSVELQGRARWHGDGAGGGGQQVFGRSPTRA